MSRATKALRFEGFSAPCYTSVPDELFDRLMVHPSLAELRVVLCVCRRTFGFKKREDAISISQMLTGIRKKDGTVVDRGVGVAKSTLMPTLRSFVQKGIIVRRDQADADGGSLPSLYSLRFRSEPGNTVIPSGGRVPKSGTPGVSEFTPGRIPEISTRKRRSPRNSIPTPPSIPPMTLATQFYSRLARRVSSQKLKRGEAEIVEVLQSRFTKAEIEYAVDYVTKKYSDTNTISRLAFFMDEAMDAKRLEDERKERSREQEAAEEQRRQRESLHEKNLEDSRNQFWALSDRERSTFMERAPKWFHLESSRIGWAIAQFQKQLKTTEPMGGTT